MGFKIRTIEGTPVTIGEKRLKPVVRLISWKRRQAIVRQNGVGGFGAKAIWLRPVAVLEETAEGCRRIPVRDKTAQTMLVLLVTALILPLTLNLLVRLIRPITDCDGETER